MLIDKGVNSIVDFKVELDVGGVVVIFGIISLKQVDWTPVTVGGNRTARETGKILLQGTDYHRNVVLITLPFLPFFFFFRSSSHLCSSYTQAIFCS